MPTVGVTAVLVSRAGDTEVLVSTVRVTAVLVSRAGVTEVLSVNCRCHCGVSVKGR